MAKIISHDFSSRKQPKNDLLTRSFAFSMQELEDKKSFLGEMILQARVFLAAQGLEPGAFILSDAYLREFLYTPFDADGQDGRYVEIVYLNLEERRITALCQFAVPEDGDFTISYQIYAREDVSTPGLKWKLFNFEDRSWVEDEEDCFDVLQLLDEFRRFANRD